MKGNKEEMRLKTICRNSKILLALLRFDTNAGSATFVGLDRCRLSLKVQLRLPLPSKGVGSRQLAFYNLNCWNFQPQRNYSTERADAENSRLTESEAYKIAMWNKRLEAAKAAREMGLPSSEWIQILYPDDEKKQKEILALIEAEPPAAPQDLGVGV